MPIRNILLTVMLLAAVKGLAQEGGDTQAQIDYAYQTEDGNRLANLIQNLTTRVKDNSADIALRYHLAHAQYRFGQLSGERHAHAAEAAFSDCIDELKPAIDKDVKSAESMVLQSACYSGLADLKSLEAALLRSRAADRLSAALKLEPRNPRAVLLSAMQAPRHATGAWPNCGRGRNCSSSPLERATMPPDGDPRRLPWPSAVSCKLAA